MDEEALARLFILRDNFAKRFFNKIFYGYQREPSDAIIKAVVGASEDKEVYIEISRQSGKTEMIVITIVFLLCYAQEIFNGLGINMGLRLWNVVIGAPQKEQAKTDFDRIKEYLRLSAKLLGITFGEANATTIKLSNGNQGFCFPITPTANIESKTGHLLVIEEAQDVPDAEANKKLLPMGTSTDSPVIRIGTAGYHLCDFHKGIHSGGPNVFVYDCWEVIKQRREAYEQDGNQAHLFYESFVKRQIRERGEHNPEVRSQYFLEWQLEKGMWMTQEVFNGLLRPDLPFERHTEEPVYIGMDVAKESDVTFITVWKKVGMKEVVTRTPATKVIEEDDPEYDPDALYDSSFGPPPKKKRVEAYMDESSVSKPVFRLINMFMIRGVLYQDQWEAVDSFEANYPNLFKKNIDSTGSGDATADYYVKKFNGWNYDTLKRMERLGLRGKVRPVKFTAQSKHVMYSNFEMAVKEGRIEVCADINNMTREEILCFNRFKAESLSALREWKGSLLSVRHPDRSKGEGGDVETDDSLDSCALVFFDPELEPAGFEMDSF